MIPTQTPPVSVEEGGGSSRLTAILGSVFALSLLLLLAILVIHRRKQEKRLFSPEPTEEEHDLEAPKDDGSEEGTEEGTEGTRQAGDEITNSVKRKRVQNIIIMLSFMPFAMALVALCLVILTRGIE